MSNYEAPSVDVPVSADDFSALFDMPQLDLLQPGLPTFDCDWTEFLNFEPDPSFFPSSPPPASSPLNTPPLVNDAILSPSSPSDSCPSSPGPLFNALPHLNKDIQSPTLREPMIQGQGLLLAPGEHAGVPSIVCSQYTDFCKLKTQ